MHRRRCVARFYRKFNAVNPHRKDNAERESDLIGFLGCLAEELRTLESQPLTAALNQEKP